MYKYKSKQFIKMPDSSTHKYAAEYIFVLFSPQKDFWTVSKVHFKYVSCPQEHDFDGGFWNAIY